MQQRRHALRLPAVRSVIRKVYLNSQSLFEFVKVYLNSQSLFEFVKVYVNS